MSDLKPCDFRGYVMLRSALIGNGTDGVNFSYVWSSCVFIVQLAHRLNQLAKPMLNCHATGESLHRALMREVVLLFSTALCQHPAAGSSSSNGATTKMRMFTCATQFRAVLGAPFIRRLCGACKCCVGCLLGARTRTQNTHKRERARGRVGALRGLAISLWLFFFVRFVRAGAPARIVSTNALAMALWMTRRVF